MDFFLIIICLLIIAIPIFLSFRKTKTEKEYDQYLEKSLEDEFLYDPETGAKITLEQAESGHWISHDNEFNPIEYKGFEKLQTPESKKALDGLNYLITSTDYKKTTLSELELQNLENLRIFDKYDDWGYDNPFRFEYCDGIVFTPAVLEHNVTRHVEGFIENQLMFCVKMKCDLGHYYLREKKTSEKVFDFIRNDDDLTLTNYESFTYKPTNNLLYLSQILKKIEGQEGLEIEFFSNYLFIKTLTFINKEDILRIENILKSI